MSKLLLVVALVLFIVLGLFGAGWLVGADHKDTMLALLGFGLAAATAAKLVP